MLYTGYSLLDIRKDIAVTKSLINLLCGLGILAGIFGIVLGFWSGSRGEFLLIPSAILTAGSLIAAAIVCTVDVKNK